ncbi:MAG: hypothetical protein HKN00_06160 [Flavobacteriaceae bacterium]|nr:hypothetical protein [Bacteroidia bacterium]NNF74748.1 hypothetical protein [Flavobacteriaceae bacterium]NNK73555.1 hypothetical protein [Flavobacteriaceae bacterium]
MKRLLLLTVCLSLLASCSSKRHIEKIMYGGNYDHAISDALKKIRPNKDGNRQKRFILLLEEAYLKAVDRDHSTIEKLKKSNNPEHYRMVYDIYVNLDARQEAIKPLMPLKVGRRVIDLPMYDYSDEIFQTGDILAKYTYNLALELLEQPGKLNSREAYSLLAYIEQISPNYKDVRQLMQQAHSNGIDYVLVDIDNQTQQILPEQLENDLLSFETYGLDQFWTAYHSVPQESVNYDYGMQLKLRQINISPDRINERMHLRQKEIVDGWEYVLDQNGNVAQDSLGNDIKVDRIVTVRARVFEIEQLKSVQLIAQVAFSDFRTNELIETFPLDSEFIFQNRFGRMRGDERALTQYDKDLIRQRRIPFPTNAQMVYDTGEDLKLKLKQILNSYHLRG